jgi:hypothetical protein
MVIPEPINRPRVSKDRVPFSPGLLGAMALGLLVGSGLGLAGTAEADVTPAPLDRSIVQGFAKGDGATVQPADEAKTEVPKTPSPAEAVVAPVAPLPAKGGAAAVADAPQGQSSMPPQAPAVSAAGPAAEPKPSVTPTTLDPSIIRRFAKDKMQSPDSAPAATPGRATAAPAPVPAPLPDQADQTSKAPLPDDQMNLIRETFSGGG